MPTTSLPPSLFSAYDWIASAGEWEIALAEPAKYAREAAENAIECQYLDVNESDLLEVINLMGPQEGIRFVIEFRGRNGWRPVDEAFAYPTLYDAYEGLKSIQLQTGCDRERLQVVTVPVSEAEKFRKYSNE